MAEFNLGKIKGAKGDRGDTGPKGDTGAKGEKGDKGDNGKDGLTPVFSVEKTLTLSPDEDAYVEINSENPANPTLSFYIPSGHNGKDAAGDMLSLIYDKNGLAQDIFEYAKNLFEACLKIEGGTLLGAVKVGEIPLAQASVRNISAGDTLPENGADGDIHIIIINDSLKKLEDCTEGDILLIPENGKEEPYRVLTKNYLGEDGVLLIREKLSSHRGKFNSTKKTEYSMSEADIFLETMYKPLLSEEITNKLLPKEVETGVFRKCFLLSRLDYTNISYLANEKNRIARGEVTQEALEYITSTINSQGSVVSINTAGHFSAVSSDRILNYRPAIILPSGLSVVNTEYEGGAAVKLPSPKCGVYICVKGEWKECSGL